MKLAKFAVLALLAVGAVSCAKKNPPPVSTTTTSSSGMSGGYTVPAK